MFKTSKKQNINPFIFLLIIIASFLATQCSDNKLPVYGVKEYDPDTKDSIDHTIQEFVFVNQDSNIVTLDNLKGKVTVVNFFFTSCPSICPIMVDQLKRFQKEVDGKYDVQILTHTVDPERDSVARLKAFIEKNKINTSNWDFVTGEKQRLYESGVYNFYLASSEDALAPGGFLHSEKFVLVDKDLKIRGYYNGTEKDDVDRLINELKLLFDE